ncbi:MAG: hypothetical protein ACFE8N_11045 [Promethearchaeota archaeon]
MEMEDDFNVSFEKIIDFHDIFNLRQCTIKEIDIKKLVNNIGKYKSFLKSLDIIFLHLIQQQAIKEELMILLKK